MVKEWESLALAAVLAASSMDAEATGNEVNIQHPQEDKIENVEQVLREDSNLAWDEVVAQENEQNSDTSNLSMEELPEVLKEDAQAFNDTMDQLDYIYERQNVATNMVMFCLLNQQSNPVLISQKYGASSEEYEQMRANGNNYIYGDFLEYLAVECDKELAQMLGVPEDKITPANMVMALANMPEIPYEEQEALYNRAKEDGREEAYHNQGYAERYLRYADRDFGNIYEGNQASFHLSMSEARAMGEIIKERYGENAEALIVKAFCQDGELAKKLGYGDEKPSAQELIYYLANAEELPLDVVNGLVTQEDRDNADKIFGVIVENGLQNSCFEFDGDLEDGRKNYFSLVAGKALEISQNTSSTQSLERQTQEEVSNTAVSNTNQNADMMRLTMMSRTR